MEVSFKDLDTTRPSSDRRHNDNRAAAVSPWQAGLNAWRSADYKSAHRIFADIARGDNDYSIWEKSGGAFWAARAADRMNERRLTQGYLKLAAQAPQTFYGQVALQILKKNPPLAVTKLPMLSAATETSISGGSSALVHAIILQESRFNRKAKSSQGARGLMQLMPATARHLDKGYKGEDELYNEAYNVRLGSSYLKMLAEKPEIAGSPFLILAAYNHGPYAMSKWLANAPDDVKSDPFLLIESYPVAQTRHYMERVMANMWAYERVITKKNNSESLSKIAKAF